MAFTGTPVIVQVADNLCRITGVALVTGATGTIGLHENSGAPDIRLPASFKPRPYERDGVTVVLPDSIEITFEHEDAGAGINFCSVAKAGNVPTTFLATLRSDSGVEGPASGDLEIYVRYH